MTTYYHNPNCTKSRKGLELLKASNIEFQVKEYLKEPMTLAELENLFAKLGQEPQDVIRKKEDIYSELGLKEKSLERAELLQIIIDYPRLLERPVLLTESKAVIGRPTEKLEAFMAELV